MARGRRNVYVIETTANVEQAVEKIRALSGDHAYIYMPNRAKQLALEPVIGPKSGLRVLTYETINADIDNDIYGFAQAIARALAKQVADKQLQWAFYVSLQDTIVARTRPAMQLAYYRERQPLGKIFWMPDEVVRYTTLWEALTTTMPDIQVAGPHAPVKSSVDAALKLVGAGKRRQLDPAQVKKALTKRGAVAVTCALGDPQYRNTILPFVHHMLKKRRDVVLIPSASLGEGNMYPFFTDHNLDPFIQSGKLVILDKTESLPSEPLDFPTLLKFSKAARRIAQPFEEFADLEPTYGRYMREVALSEAPRILAECRLLWPQMSQIAERSAVVTVCPGRPMRSTLLVAAARANNRRSIEIQSGTIAKTRRFVAPQADRVLVMDEESRETYAHLTRAKGVDIIGSIRLEYDLANYRSISKEEARRQLDIPLDQELWTLATQPIGVQSMSKVAEVVFGAARRFGATVMVKMHPNETPSYEAAYRDLGKKHKGLKVIIERQAKSVLAAIASDIVLTHFSTVGIEAYALGRTTVAVNPFDQRPTFDLVKMQVALEAKNSDDLFAIASNRAALTPPKNPLTDGKVLERCEYWVKRLSAVPPAKRKPVVMDTPVNGPLPSIPAGPKVSGSRKLVESQASWQAKAILLVADNTKWLPRPVRTRLAKLVLKRIRKQSV